MSAANGGRRALLIPQGESSEPKLRVVTTADCVPVAVGRGDRAVSISLSITPGPPPPGWEYVAAFIRGRLSAATVVTDLRGPSELSTAVSGVGKSTFDWYIGGFDGDALPNAPLVVHADVPAEEVSREVELVVRADFSLTRTRFLLLPGRRLEHARVDLPWNFTLTLPGCPRPSSAASAEVRLCVAADIARYSRFLNPEAALAQERFVELLRAARAHAGVDESAVQIQCAGDGQYVVFPPGIDETVVIPRLLEGIEIALRSANRDLGDHDRLRIRVAIDRGIVVPSVNGYVGRSTIAVHRLLDSQVLRDALADRVQVDHAIIVSETVYQDVVRHEYGGVDSAEFIETVVHLPHKNFTERAWLHSPSR